MDKVKILRNVKIFSALSDEALQVIAEHSGYYEIKPESYLFKSGTKETGLGILLEGELVVQKALRSPEGKERTIEVARYVSGDTFGELDLIKEESVRETDIIAAAPSSVLIFPKKTDCLSGLLDRYPHILGKMLAEFMKMVASRIRETNRLIAQNEPWIREIRRQVSVDKLTGLFNASRLEEEIEHNADSESPGGVLVIFKPDNFKDINDTFGHEIGDRVLKRMGEEIRDCIGKEGVVCRYKGNEIGCFLPGADTGKAVAAAEGVRSKVAAADISDITGSAEIKIVLSAGITVFTEPNMDGQNLIEDSRRKVFTARKKGGNRIILAEEDNDVPV
ncbi:MAG: diguanylate cyclase domain-containing protein [Spirochaetia bacterium]